MRKLLILCATCVFCTITYAQVNYQPIITLRDSTGTANTFWQTVGIGLKGVQKGFECVNDGSVNLKFALSGFDTTAAQTTRSVTIKPGEVFKVNPTTRDSVYVKSVSATAAYRIRTFQ